jgi:TRAP-type C4-dicarboxylate transport system permease small subunit
MRKKDKDLAITYREILRSEYMFFWGITVGISTGIIGNLFVSFFMKWIDDEKGAIIGLIITVIALVFISFCLYFGFRSINKKWEMVNTYLIKEK